MLRKRLPAILFLIFSVFIVSAQHIEGEKQPRILILLDGSSSMLQPWVKDEIRFKAAASIITKLIDSIYTVNPLVEFGLRVYGHQHAAQENNCIDTKREVMFSKNNLTQISLRLEALHPVGVSPIAYSLKEAAENEMADSRNYNYSLILITDGGESCGGNICEVVKLLLEKKISFKPYIVSLVDFAPLKEQYNCLGEYLLATKETDIPITVGKIVDAYRPMLTLTAANRKKLETAVINAPSVLKVAIPKVKITNTTDNTDQAPPTPVAKPQPKPKPKQEPVEQVVTPQVDPPPAKDLTNRSNIVVAEAPPKIDIAALRMKPFRILPNILITENMRKKAGPPMPSFKPLAAEPTTPIVSTPAPVIPKPVAKVIKPREPELKEAKYTVQREDAKETTLEIYFTDGKGKFYETIPQVFLSDPKTGQQLHKFYRTVGPTGNPDPQNIPVGTYNLTVKGKSNLLVKNIEVKPNTKNKYLVQVNKASIIFSYEGNPNRPVSEYVAIVNRRFAPGPTIRQGCTQEFEYEPGTYYIEINTLPAHKRNFDLDFGSQYDIRIPEDGFLNITNTNNVGKVDLYCPLGDTFVKFHQIEVNGSAGGQKVTIQPGTYEAHFVKYTGAAETKIKFKINSNNTTDLLLE
jgi:hypothetical protein